MAEQMELALEAQKRQAAGGGGLSGLWGMYQQGADATAKQIAAENSGSVAATAAAPAKPGPVTTTSPLSSSALSRAARKRR